MSGTWRQLPGVPVLRRSVRAVKRTKYRLWDSRRFDGKLRIYLTLRCNLSCRYCVNEHNPSESRSLSYPLRGGAEWVEAINRIGRPVILTGGEPSLHPDFFEILDGIRWDLGVAVFTNFCFDPHEFIGRVHRPIQFFGTYHPVSGPPQPFLDTVGTLRENGVFRGHIHIVDWRKHEHYLDKTRDVFLRAGWDPVRDTDHYTLSDCASMRFRRTVRCSREIILIAPDGGRYLCVSKLVRRTDPLENIFEGPPKEGVISRVCNDYGFCAPCDAVGVTPMRVDRRELLEPQTDRVRVECSDSTSSLP